MNEERGQDSQTEEVLPAQLRLGFLSMLQAYKYAQNVNRDRWDFAVEIASLREAGLANSDLRWLVCKGYVEHAREVSVTGEDKREFREAGALTFSKRTCFVLTETGAEVAESILTQRVVSTNGQVKAKSNAIEECLRRPLGSSSGNGAGQSPIWDHERRELRVSGRVVKVFKLPSPNQEMILTAFAEEQWPPRIDDPLPPHPEVLSKQRLRDAIKSLNRNQKARLIRFMGNGTGEGVRWELADSADQTD